MPRKADRPHRAALTRMFRATGVVNMPDKAPLVELLRTLADEMDAGGGSRVQAQYRAALKDLWNMLNAAPGRMKKAAESVPSEDESELDEGVEGDGAGVRPKSNDLADFKKRKGISA